MSKKKPLKIVKGISTSVLFDMSEPAKVYDEHGPDAYIDYMVENADKPLPLGPNFKELTSLFNDKSGHMEVVICSRNSPLTARRAVNTLAEHGITPERMMFTSGKSPVPFLKPYEILHFQTTNERDAEEANAVKVFATHHKTHTQSDTKIISLHSTEEKKVTSLSDYKKPTIKETYNGRAIEEVVLDLDGVTFDQDGEQYFQQAVKDFGFDAGLQKYRDYQRKLKKVPMGSGPAFEFLKRIAEINDSYSGKKKPFILSIVTAQGAEAAVRAIETLHAWGIEFNGSAHFLAGGSKQEILNIMQKQSLVTGVPCIFFDDQPKNINQAINAGMSAGRVPGFGAEKI